MKSICCGGLSVAQQGLCWTAGLRPQRITCPWPFPSHVAQLPQWPQVLASIDRLLDSGQFPWPFPHPLPAYTLVFFLSQLRRSSLTEPFPPFPCLRLPLPSEGQTTAGTSTVRNGLACSGLRPRTDRRLPRAGASMPICVHGT